MITLNKKVKAFTLAEMLVVLVISGIVISLTMLILSLVQKQLKIIQTNNNQTTEIRLLERALWQDFNKHRLFYNNTKQQLHCISEIDTVLYTFKEDYIIRNKDTMNVPIFKTTTYLDGNPVKEKHIDAIELQLSKEIADKKIFIYTSKDASYYINNNGI
ncbi:MAG: type II secretion system GspH family protein [Flavobacteriaceae bacterium]|nr:type II secretion system GspH family protein [Flavobacteriaceae bacterium]